MANNTWRNVQWVQDLVLATAAPVVLYFAFRNLFNRLDQDGSYKAEAEESKKKAIAANRHLDSILARKEAQDEDDDYDSSDDEEDRAHNRRLRLKDLALTQYEQTIALQVIAPDEIPVTFEDIGGLDNIIEELKESVIYPLTLPHLYSHSSSLLTAPSGVLLHGPPGCGKTMLAKALAHESGASFINLHISTLTEKWYGDSNKLVNAVFSLARKLQPSIVFIDEIDAVLGQRSSGEHEASAMVKAEFMTHWDGLTSSSRTGSPQRICVLGATNRMHDIDGAILRRMPKKFGVPLPSATQRRRIFRLVLKDTKTDGDSLDLDRLVKWSAGLSGSAIKDACREAAMVPVRECIRERARVEKEGALGGGGGDGDGDGRARRRKRAARDGRGGKGGLMREVRAEEVRGLRTEDFLGKGEMVGGVDEGEVEDHDGGWSEGKGARRRSDDVKVGKVVGGAGQAKDGDSSDEYETEEADGDSIEAKFDVPAND